LIMRFIASIVASLIVLHWHEILHVDMVLIDPNGGAGECKYMII